MEEKFRGFKQNPATVLLLSGGAVFLFLKWIVPPLAPILSAILFVTIFGPLLQKMQRLHLHRHVGAIVLLIIALLAVAALLMGAIWWLKESFPLFLEEGEKWKNHLPDWADRWVDTLLMQIRRGESSLGRGIQGGALRYMRKAVSFGGYLMTFLIAVVLLAKDYDEIMNLLLEREDCYLLLRVLCSVIRFAATYIKAQGVIMLLIAGLCASVLGISGGSQGIVWGILAGILDAMPFIGTGAVLLPMAVFKALEGRTAAAVLCVLLYLTCVFLREMIEPRLIGRKIGVRPIFVLISLYAGIRLFGMSGILKGPLGFLIVWEIWKTMEKSKNKKSL